MSSPFPQTDDVSRGIDRLLAEAERLVERSRAITAQSENAARRTNVLIARSTLIHAGHVLDKKRNALKPAQYNALHRALPGLERELALGTPIDLKLVNQIAKGIENLPHA